MNKRSVCAGERREGQPSGRRGAGERQEEQAGGGGGGGRLDRSRDEQELSLEVFQPREDAEAGGNEPGAFQDRMQATVAGAW